MEAEGRKILRGICKKNMKIKQSESDVMKAVRKLLGFEGYEVYRINNGGTKREDKHGNEFYTFNGTPGVFDLYCVKPGSIDMWIETKATGKKPSEDQLKFMRLVNSVPGRYAFWADSFDMFLAQFNDIKNGYGLPKLGRVAPE